jgi:hypothetical protein
MGGQYPRSGQKARHVPEFDWLAFHPNFEQHQEDEGRTVVSCSEVDDVWYGERTIFPNRKTGRGRYLMTGLTRGRRPITVVICGTDLGDTWLAYTAWPSK